MNQAMRTTSAANPRACAPLDRARSIPIGSCEAGAEQANRSAARRTRCSVVRGRMDRTRDIPARVIGRRARSLTGWRPGRRRSSATGARGLHLGQALRDALAPLGEALLELVERRTAIADERELTVEVAGGGDQQVLALGRLRGAAVTLADQRARLLGLDEPAQVLERETEQLLELEDLAQALDVGVGVAAVLAVVAVLGAGQEPDLLVVAHRAHGRPGALGALADAHRPLGHRERFRRTSPTATVEQWRAVTRPPRARARDAAGTRPRRRPMSRRAPTALCACWR